LGIKVTVPSAVLPKENVTVPVGDAGFEKGKVVGKKSRFGASGDISLKNRKRLSLLA
jgi:hypothetical protein